MEPDVTKDTLIYIVDDEPIVREVFEDWISYALQCKVRCFEDGEDFLKNFGKDNEFPDVILLDLMMPNIDGITVLKRLKENKNEIPVIVISAQNVIDTAVNAIRLGAYDYLTKPIEDFDKFEILLRNAVKNSSLRKEVSRLRALVSEQVSFPNIISNSPKMQRVFNLIEKTLTNDVTVMILGESGTGKELIAKAIHYNSHRKNGPFVVLNCAAIPKDLLESELFGHVKGAFTGAVSSRKGKFELANNGTIFLDEIGELHVELQAKLLRVIQEGEFTQVGGEGITKTNARILSATNKDLETEVKNGNFREDLYYRLNTFPINLPPLRERTEDIILLANFFSDKFCQKFKLQTKSFSKSASKFLLMYDWPGNIRELENMIERCVLISDEEITEGDLPIGDSIEPKISLNSKTLFEFNNLNEVPEFEFIKFKAIEVAYNLANKNISVAAKTLGLGRATFYRLMKKYEIN
ncbi:MAG: sigma-54-dependent Fis family transcriptional regulator [Calditrichaeota bacterium]|nr:MAG: sigma-54-dependent Fis family transcriptional regulator [Calditrichota bacterium]